MAGSYSQIPDNINWGWGAGVTPTASNVGSVSSPTATETTTYPGTTAATTGAIASGMTVYSQLPGYSESIANIGKTVQSETAGQVPDDVIATLKQQGAEGNVATGAASNAAYLHALGLTSLGLEKTGADTLNSTVQNLPGAAISQNSQYYQTQQQAQDYSLQQQLWQQQQQQQQLALQQQQEALAAAKSSSQGDVYTTDSAGNIRKNGWFYSTGSYRR